MVSEIMVGALLHDQGPFSHNKEGGIDTNMELLFPSPDLLSGIWKPRPHFGFSWNSAGDTSQVYVGLTWDWEFLGSGFFNFSLGGAYHTGETRTTKLDKKELGCSILFRESLDLGYRISGPHSVMLHLDHISNAKLCSSNEGLESFGLRYGYRF
ncbi:MAG: acyloxyacyl hydrolase [Rhodospirillales bacterium]|jgi:lipid A 3-O-deacylase|nr:acyloxyacyl hydrolase [Rhodospirillales bacterium]